jgi:hypothetical protein
MAQTSTESVKLEIESWNQLETAHPIAPTTTPTPWQNHQSERSIEQSKQPTQKELVLISKAADSKCHRPA